MLEDETFEKFLLSPLKRRGEGVQKIAEKIRYLRPDAFVDNPLYEVEYLPPRIFFRNLFEISKLE